MGIVELAHDPAQPLPDLGQAFPDILSMLRSRAQVCPQGVAIQDVDGTSCSYADLLPQVERLALHLAGQVPGRGRARIGMVLPNGATMSRTLLAVTLVGAALPFNPGYTLHEFESYFAETDIGLLVTVGDFAPLAQQAARKLGIAVLDLAQPMPDAPSGRLALPGPDDTAMVLLTSGSTGKAKRVPLSHRNVCTSARDVGLSLRLTPADRCLSMWELYHVGGLVDLLLAPLHSGGTVIASRGFDAARFFDHLARHRPTWFQAVPTALGEIALLAQRDGLAVKGTSLRFLRSVAAALSPALMAEIEVLFGLPVLQTFGMTEAAPLICSTGFDPADRIPGSVGRSCGTEIGIFDSTWQRQGSDIEGEVAIRGPNVFSGYEADPAANLDAFRDGWFRTGDLGRLDAQGRLFLTGRIKELVNRGGEKVNLREVDDALLAHPAVFEAATFAIPHRTLGEDVAAAVVTRPGTNASEADIRSALAARLAAFKIPRRILFVPALPRNAVGKIDRRLLAADMIARIESEAAQPAPAPSGAISDAEARIAAIWAQELGLPSVGPDQDFVLSGGDSLAGLRVLLAVEAAFDRSLPDDALAQISTVRAMAAVLGAKGQPRRASGRPVDGSVTPEELRQIQAIIALGPVPVLRQGALFKVINPQGSRQPLIWFYNDPAKEMAELSQRFPSDRPLFGGFSGGSILDMRDATMDRLARLYVADLMAEFPQGSFLLGGNCKGARLAWEVAQQLSAQGREVERLCLMEFAAPELARFDRPLLLMFKAYSRRRAYRSIGWGNPGWEQAFARPPVATWIDGAHGGSFKGRELDSFLAALLAFLDDQPRREGTLASADGQRILRMHQNPLHFALARAAHKIATRLRHGRRQKRQAFNSAPSR